MNTNNLIIGVLALLIGFGAGYVVVGREAQTGEHVMPNGAVMEDKDMTMGGAMDDMMAGLKDKKGDDFDKAFLSEMIVHHQGAVDMAEAALVNAKHEEIKAMARAIIDAQTHEIGQMQGWESEWYQIGR